MAIEITRKEFKKLEAKGIPFIDRNGAQYILIGDTLLLVNPTAEDIKDEMSQIDL